VQRAAGAGIGSPTVLNMSTMVFICVCVYEGTEAGRGVLRAAAMDPMSLHVPFEMREVRYCPIHEDVPHVYMCGCRGGLERQA